MNEHYESWKAIVEKAARYVASDFPDVSYEDVEGHLWLFLAERHIIDHDPAREGMNNALFRQAQWYAWEQRKQHLTLSSQYSYRTKDITLLLETLFEKSKWTEAFVPDDARTDGYPKEVDALDLSSDLQWAFDRLPLNYKRVLFVKYALREHVADYKLLTRAKQRLADILNTYSVPAHEGPGNRRVLSNSQARGIIHHDRDGDT